MKSDAATAREPLDRGVSLVEVLVAMGLFGLLGTLLLGFALGTSQVTDDTRRLAAVNEESRLAMERLARELRQAERIDAFTLPAGPAADPISMTFWTNFDGDQPATRDYGLVDPEVLTYRWTPSTRELTLTVNEGRVVDARTGVLATNVSTFTFDLYSSRWEYDLNADGLTTWRELDQAVGDNDGVPDPAELELVDRVDVSMTVLDGARSQTHRTQIDLRNGS